MPVFRRGRAAAAAATERRIRAAIDGMRPLLRVQAFAVELVRFDAASRTARLKFGGDCPDCAMTAATLMGGIEAHIRREVPEVRAVVAG